MTDQTHYSADDLSTAARLLSWGLRVKQRPSGNKEYADLVRRWQESARVQGALQALVEGQSMVLLGVDVRDGVILAAQRHSPFSLGITDLRATAKQQLAAHMAIVLASIVATFFPTSDSVDDDDRALPTLRTSQIIATLSELVRALEEKASNEALPEDVVHIWRSLSRLPVSAERKEDAKRDSMDLKSLEGLVRNMLTHMANNNLTTAYSEDELIQARERFRLQVRHHGIPTLLEIARAAITKHGIANPFSIGPTEEFQDYSPATPKDPPQPDARGDL
jgi:hypothetical protein